LKKHYETNKIPGVLSALYDTELFGHWWFEGPQFLKKLWRKFSQNPEVSLATSGHVLELSPPTERISIPEGSWGEGGHHYIWLNKDTVWTWEKIYEAEKKYLELVQAVSADEHLQRVLTQLGRELLLLESSDWQFLISTFAARDYAEMRFAEHWEKFNRLSEMAENIKSGNKLNDGDRNYLKDCEESDKLFADFSVQSFWPVEYQTGTK
jgi:1,4-alpha-glucan branching enzyme